MMDVRKLSSTYFRWMMRLGCFTYILYRFVFYILGCTVSEDVSAELSGMLDRPMVISALFVIVTALIFSMLWRWISSNSPESLTTFYNVSSGLRMLLALGVITTYYLVYGQEMITPMALTFMVMYFLQLIVHSAFFTKYLK